MNEREGEGPLARGFEPAEMGQRQLECRYPPTVPIS